METFAKHMHVKVMHVDASDEFYSALEGVADPEAEAQDHRQASSSKCSSAKRRRSTTRSGSRRARSIPDVIESAGAKTKKAMNIKSHHNVGGLARDAASEAARAAARALQGRGARARASRSACRTTWCSAIRSRGRASACASSGEVKREYADLLRRADAIFIDELRAAGWYEQTAQAFAVFLPVRSVGVMGDGRTYEYVVALRAVQTRRLHDRAVGRASARAALARLEPHHQRSARHQPRRLRHLQQAARDDRVGIVMTEPPHSGERRAWDRLSPRTKHSDVD